MRTSKQYEYISDASFFVSDYCFYREERAEFLKLNPKENTGTGGVVEISPRKGLYLSCANWTPKINMERKYYIPKEFIKLYFLENGNVTLIQNGKKKSIIQHGVNLYLNRPVSGRVLYGAMTPICYVSILIHGEYFDKIATAFPKNGLSREDVFLWTYKDYNTPEITRVFVQIREKMIEGITSAVYSVLFIFVKDNTSFKDLKPFSNLFLSSITCQEERSHMMRGHRRGPAFELGPDGVGVLHFFARRRRDPGAALRHDQDVAVVRQAPESFSHRRAAHAELLGQANLRELLSRQQLLVEDRSANREIGDVRRGRIRIAVHRMGGRSISREETGLLHTLPPLKSSAFDHLKCIIMIAHGRASVDLSCKMSGASEQPSSGDGASKRRRRFPIDFTDRINTEDRDVRELSSEASRPICARLCTLRGRANSIL